MLGSKLSVRLIQLEVHGAGFGRHDDAGVDDAPVENGLASWTHSLVAALCIGL